MATVTKNPDGTFTVTLTPKEARALKRHGDEVQATPVKVLDDTIEGAISGWAQDQAAADGPVRLSKFGSLSVVKQDAIDALLNGG